MSKGSNREVSPSVEVSQVQSDVPISHSIKSPKLSERAQRMVEEGSGGDTHKIFEVLKFQSHDDEDGTQTRPRCDCRDPRKGSGDTATPEWLPMMHVPAMRYDARESPGRSRRRRRARIMLPCSFRRCRDTCVGRPRFVTPSSYLCPTATFLCPFG
jgi:hypothetical protein